MNSGHPSVGSGHIQNQGSLTCSTSKNQESCTMLSAGAAAGPSAAVGLSIFRGNLTQGESSSRMHGSTSGQFSSGSGGSSNSSLGPYSPLYNVHGQSSSLTSLSPYPSFFPQYPASHYSPSSMVASVHYPRIESYSAMLASMGSHVQHSTPTGSQTSGSSHTSSFLPASASQYTHRSLSANSSPSPGQSSVPAHSPSGKAPLYHSHDRDSLLAQNQDQDRDNFPQKVLVVPGSESHQEEKKLLHSVGVLYSARGSSAAVLNDSLFGDPSDPFYKVPSGKEGSLKHRILTRPHDIPLDANTVEDKCLSQADEVEEDSLGKRTQYSGVSTTIVVASVSGSALSETNVFTAPYALGLVPASLHTQHHLSTGAVLPVSPSSPYSHTPISSSPSTLSPSQSAAGLPPHLHYPSHFVKGSIIQLANGDLKRVEDLQTEDFVSSAHVSVDLKVDSSTVVRIEEHPEQGTATLGFSVGEHRVQVTVEATLEHPFFVFGQGWSSCSTERTLHRYGLDCHKLAVGDVCISLSHKDVSLRAAEIVSQQQSEKQSRITLPDSERNVNQQDSGEVGTKENIIKDEGKSEANSVHKGESSGMNTSESCNRTTNVNQAVEPSGSISHAHNLNLHSPVSPSQISESSCSDNRAPRKRRWSAPESDLEKETVNCEKECIESSQKQ